MYTLELKFEKTTNTNTETQVEAIVGLLGSWYKNGQVVGDHWPLSEEADGFSAFINTPDKDALDAKHNNKYVQEGLSRLEAAGLKLQITVRGKDPDSAPVCQCNEHDAGYVLYTTYLSCEPALRCFFCFGTVPHYTIPKTYDDEYYNINAWESDYKACDTLQMNCTVGEQFATDQMSDIDSELTRQGRDICEIIESLTNSKTYYYLFRDSENENTIEEERKCPGCGGEWHRETPCHDIFDFVCDKCGLLSNIAWSARL